MRIDRRQLVKLLSLGIPGLALAHEGHGHGRHGGHGHGGSMATAAVGPDLLPARPIPWDNGKCDFCEMPLKTPPTFMGRTFQPGFFEQTYSQIAKKEGAHHFESIACMVNYAYVYGIRDGYGTTFYVTDRGQYDPAKGPDSVRLIPARQAVYLWAEKRGWVVMDAKIAAFSSREAAMAFAKANPDLGRTRILDWQTLLDLAPLPEMNLVNLLAKHAGLLK